MANMKLDTLRIPVTSLASAVTTYSTVFDMTPTFGSVDEGFVGYRLSNVTVLLELAEKGEFEAGRYLGFSLEVDNLQPTFELLSEKGITFVHPPQRQDWGGLMTHVVDDCGNSFSLVEIS